MNKPFKTLFPNGRLYTGETDRVLVPDGGLRATHRRGLHVVGPQFAVLVYDKVLRCPVCVRDALRESHRRQDAAKIAGRRRARGPAAPKACGVEKGGLDDVRVFGLGAGVLRRER